MNFPAELKYTKSHEWLRIDGNIAIVGITDYAQSELGDIVFVDVTAQPGDTLAEGETFGTIEAVKTVSDLYMPIAGTIVEVNGGLNDNPESINGDPYGAGWMVRIEIAADADHSVLMEQGAYSESIGH